MANMEKIADKLAILPALPGCYLMKNMNIIQTKIQKLRPTGF